MPALHDLRPLLLQPPRLPLHRWLHRISVHLAVALRKCQPRGAHGTVPGAPVRRTASRRTAENHRGPATAIRPAVSRTDNHRAATAGEGMATEIHLVTAGRRALTTAMAQRARVMVDIQAVNARTLCIRTSLREMGGIGYRMSLLTRITGNR
ncbi:hypothetical protein AWC03_08630 [Mycobacterium europaeum]|nr:hypothetical protein AWC03_08630 [Mycobacterium europaeum]